MKDRVWAALRAFLRPAAFTPAQCFAQFCTFGAVLRARCKTWLLETSNAENCTCKELCLGREPPNALGSTQHRSYQVLFTV
jgi:hypothetical protein